MKVFPAACSQGHHEVNVADCESFEVAIEMQRHGALDPVQASALELHLKTCPSCHRYLALAHQTESTMLGHAQTLSLEALDARVSQHHDAYRLKSWAPVAVNSAMGILLALRFHNLWFLAFIGVGFLVMGGVRLRVVLESRQQARVARSAGDLLAFYRGLLERRIRRIRVMSVAVPVFAAVALPVAFLAPDSRDLPMIAIIAVPLLGAAAVLWFLRLKKVPALRRELEELGGN